MNRKINHSFLIIAAVLALISSCSQPQQKDETTSTKVESKDSSDQFSFLPDGYPGPGTADKLLDEIDYQRACQLYIWAIPIVGMTEWKNVNNSTFKVHNAQWVSYRTFEEKLGILTPNFTTPYAVGFCNLTESGPLVIDFPKGLLGGMVMDFWQRSLTDLGMIGPDKGQGGKYLIIGPGQADLKPSGYYIIHSPTNNIFFGTRILDPAQADELIPKMNAYPYKNAGNAPKPDVVKSGTGWSQMPPHGMLYWQRLAEIINQEPVEERDRFMMAQLRFLGIEKGKPFQPDARQTRILTEGAKTGEMMAKVNTYTRRFAEPMWPGTHWKDVLTVNTTQYEEFYDQLDSRAAYFYEGVAISEGMRLKKPGPGQRYVGCYQDKDGEYLSGSNLYKIHVPANPPVGQFWSLTVYDEATRQMIVNGNKKVDFSSKDTDLVKNADGSWDLYCGPEAPKGFEKNWVQTNKDNGWFSMFRFYAPTEAFFNKSWVLPDFEKVTQ
jgi:hypothetical protein